MKLERATAWSLLPILTLSTLSIATVPVFYHSLGTDFYALWFAIQTMTGTFGFMDLGLGLATGRFVGIALGRGDFAGARETWASGNLLNLVLLLLMAAAFGILGSWLGTQWFSLPTVPQSLFVQCVWWSSLGLFFNYYAQGWQILLQAHLEFRWLALSRTAFSLATGIGMSWCAWVFRNPLPCIIFGAAAGGLQLLVLMSRAKTQHQMGPLLALARWSRLREMGSYTAKTFLSLLSGAAFGSLDRWLLGRIAGSESFVAYNIGSNLAARVQGLSVAAMGPIFHGSTRGVGLDDRAQLAEIYRRAFQMMAPVYFAGALWATLWQGPWLRLWLGADAGTQVASVLPFLIWAAAWSAWMNISGAQLGPLNLVGFGTWVQSGSWLLSGILAWVGWHGAGLVGAGAGLMGGRGLLMIQDAKIRKLLGVSIFDRHLFTQLLSVAGAVTFCWIICGILPVRREIPLLFSIANLLILAWLLFRLPPSFQRKD
jgi:O-antigen/teichoic acid export membrane protein